MDSELRINDLNKLTNVFYDIRHKWVDISIELGLNNCDVESIKMKRMGTPILCLMDACSARLSRVPLLKVRDVHNVFENLDLLIDKELFKTHFKVDL